MTVSGMKAIIVTVLLTLRFCMCDIDHVQQEMGILGIILGLGNKARVNMGRLIWRLY